MIGANAHGISDAASVAFSALVPCVATGCEDGMICGDTCELCGGSARVGRLDAVLYLAKMAMGLRGYVGGFAVEHVHGRGPRVTWTSPMGNRTDIDRLALRAARELCEHAGLDGFIAPGLDVLFVRGVPAPLVELDGDKVPDTRRGHETMGEPETFNLAAE